MSSAPIILSTEAPSLRFEDEKQQSQFELGVACAVFLWEDLATAVASGWGGPESAEKREWLAGSVVELFDGNEVATDDIEYRLLAAMEDEFDATLETDTAMAVAHQVISVYQECSKFNYDLTQQLFEKYQSKAPSNVVTVKDEIESVGDSDEEAETLDHPDEAHSMEVDEPPNLVDSEGFTTVQRRRR